MLKNVLRAVACKEGQGRIRPSVLLLFHPNDTVRHRQYSSVIDTWRSDTLSKAKQQQCYGRTMVHIPVQDEHALSSGRLQ